MKFYNYIIILLFSSIFSFEENYSNRFTISRIHYDGGGDWYADPSSLSNLLNFVGENTLINTQKEESNVKIGDDQFYLSQYLYMTGHGNIKLSSDEIAILRGHLLNGAFLHADDNYGMDKSFRHLVELLFPEKELIEIPPSHNLFNCYYKFNNGLPKIHEHDNKPPQALGLFDEEKLILLYTYESDLGDGWEDKNVHNVPEDKRLSALKMGTNIIIHALAR